MAWRSCAGAATGAWWRPASPAVAGLADVVVAVAPAAHCEAGDNLQARQLPDLRALVEATRAATTRLAVANFRDDPFDYAPEERPVVLRGFAPRVAAFLLLDRPEGLTGHGAGARTEFNDRFGACLLRFGTAPAPPSAC